MKLAFVFPGQGSQTVGMLSELANHYSLIQEVFSAASASLGYDVWKLVQDGPESTLNQTQYTQVTMLTADVAVFKLLESLNVETPQIMAGHSLGEYAALVCAGAIDLADAAMLVSKRGELMQSSIPLGLGAMAAVIGLDDEQVESICSEVSQGNVIVTPANYNALGQVVIAGHTRAVQDVINRCEAAGARMAKIIPVSVPCHCPLLHDASEVFGEELAKVKFKTPQIPVISNVNLSVYDSPNEIRALLKQQLHQPVRWVETIQLMKRKGVEYIIECGPGKVLSGLIKRIDKSILTFSVNDVASLEHAQSESYA